MTNHRKRKAEDSHPETEVSLDLAKRVMPNPRILDPNRMNTGAVPGLGDVVGATGELGNNSNAKPGVGCD